MKGKIIAIVIVLALVAILAGFGIHRSKVQPVKNIDQIQEEDGYPVEVGSLRVGDLQQTVALTGSVEPLDKQVITAKVSGKIDVVYVREGDTVKKGQAIAKLEQDTFKASLKQAQMSLNQQKASLSQAIVDKQNTVVQTDANVKNAKIALQSAQESLKLAKKPYRSQQIIQQENTVNSAKYNYDQALKDAERYESLYKQGAVSLSDYENIKLKADVNKKSYDSALEQLSLLKEQGRSEDIRKAELGVRNAEETLRQAKSNALQVAMKDENIKMIKAAIASAEAAVETAQDSLNNTVIVAKVDGVVSKRNMEPGQTISGGSNLGEIVSIKDMFYLAQVSETDIDTVKVGQSVEVKLDGIKGTTFNGKVATVYPVADSSTRSYSVKVKILDATASIKAGMFAKGIVNTNLKPNVIIAPKSAVRTSQGVTSIFVLADDQKSVKQVNVEKVSQYGEELEIEPVKAGALEGTEKIVVSGIDSLSDESKIKIE